MKPLSNLLWGGTSLKMSKIVDARGLPCPQPVLLTKKALSEASEVTVIVDNEVAQQNVSRFATRAGCRVETDELEDGIHLHLTKTIGRCEARSEVPMAGPTVLFISANSLGRGPEELGSEVLIPMFLHTLSEVSPLPDTVIFINSGVKLVAEGSKVVEDLRALADRGVEILACGTCLDYFQLKDRVLVGQVSNMYTIAEVLLRAGKVITI